MGLFHKHHWVMARGQENLAAPRCKKCLRWMEPETTTHYDHQPDGCRFHNHRSDPFVIAWEMSDG